MNDVMFLVDALQDFDEEVGSITKQVHRHNANLTQAQALGYVFCYTSIIRSLMPAEIF